MSQRGVYEREPGIWYIRYADTYGKIRREKGGTYAAAVNLYHKRKQQVLEGQKLPESLRKPAILFDELVADMLEYSKAHHGQRHYHSSTLKGPMVLSWFRGRAANCVTSLEIERKLNIFAEKRKPATVNRLRAFIQLIFSVGVKNKKIEANPVSQIKIRRENNVRIRFLDEREEKTLRKRIRAICPEREPEFDLALHTGMRQGEMYSLRWDTVHLDQNILTIVRSKHGGSRHIPINPKARAALAALWARRDGNGRVVPLLRPPMTMKGEERFGYCPTWFRDKIVKGSGVENFHWHDLRHTFASRLVMAGVDIRTVQELMGHKTIQMTLRYAHLAPSHLHEAVERLARRHGTRVKYRAHRRSGRGRRPIISRKPPAKPASRDKAKVAVAAKVS